ncbi:uncharacterized protein L203_101036 [Cryptococcus depauperatus CBS 7841]|uniref:Vacuolar protein sorting-associated protein 27 n=1 Tax=Cryptococcus depauperatus CBS 7841 TaxID=1295531 RepID=A0A1E3IKP2_9TREE|nr:vacuolar protein sorting-associated protein 27 [Cryptococcus depauperatus CBS 7841]
MSWLWGSSTNPQFEELIEKACSPLNLPYPQSEDIATSLEAADMIRAKAVQPKSAMQSLKRRLTSKNGRVQMYVIGLLDTCIKNGGDHFLVEIASKEFVDEMANLIRSESASPEVHQMLIKYFQQWALAFQLRPELSFFVDVYNEFRNSGVSFPPPPAPIPSHLLTTATAPAWIDSDVCMRCRSAFTFTNRKHHCRNCGLIFDQACSSHTMALPKYGITDEVRVCDGCWMTGGRGKADAQAPAVPGKTLRSRADVDADLQRAIELSLAEPQPGGVNYIPSEPPLAQAEGKDLDYDDQMRLAIEASLRDVESRPSAPAGIEEPEYRPLPTFDLTPRENETVLAFSNTIDQMVAYGERDLKRFPHAHVLAEQACAVGEKLRMNVEEKATKQQMLMEMQAKLSEAVHLYGQILDGQQAYTQRKLQEEQARRYQEQQQQYYGVQQYQTQPYSQYMSNGFQQSAAPQQYYQPPRSQTQTQTVAPSMYPSIPLVTSGFIPQQPFRQEATSMPSAYSPHWTPSPAPIHSSTQTQQQSVASKDFSVNTSFVSSPNLSVPHRQTSATYDAPVPVIEDNSTIHAQPSIPREISSAPPPVDLSTHPSSPTRQTSLSSALLQASHSQEILIQSTPHAPSVDLSRNGPYANEMTFGNTFMETTAMGPEETQYERSQEVQQYPTQAQQQPTLPYTRPNHSQSQNQSQSQSQLQYAMPNAQAQQQQHQLPPGHYNAASFPQPLPPTVFPDAPLDAPKGLEKQEKEETLLIEL